MNQTKKVSNSWMYEYSNFGINPPYNEEINYRHRCIIVKATKKKFEKMVADMLFLNITLKEAIETMIPSLIERSFAKKKKQLDLLKIKKLNLGKKSRRCNQDLEKPWACLSENCKKVYGSKDAQLKHRRMIHNAPLNRIIKRNTYKHKNEE